MDELAEIFADLGFAVAEGARDRGAVVQFHRAQHARVPPGAGDAGHFLLRADRRVRRRRAARAAHPHLAGADPDDDVAAAADPDHRAGPRLSLRQRRHPHADVPPDRRAGDRPQHHHGPPQVDAGDLPQGLFRARRRRAADAAVLLPVHRAVGRSRRRLVDGEGPPRRRRQRGLDGGPRLAGWSTPR